MRLKGRLHERKPKRTLLARSEAKKLTFTGQPSSEKVESIVWALYLSRLVIVSPNFPVIITSIPDFSLQYDEELSLLRVEWAAGDDTRNLRASALALLRLDQELNMQNLLLNVNTFPDISVYDQVWLGTHWMPGIVKLPLQRVVLINNRHRVHNQLAIESMLALGRPFIRFDIQFFPNAASGMDWLSDFSPRLPGLMAEWNAVHAPESPSHRHQPERL